MSSRNYESSISSHPGSNKRTIGSEHYHGAMKKEHPDWNFCPTCNASLAEQTRSDVMSLLLTSAQSQLVISTALTPALGTGTLSPFSLRGDTKVPVWAEATQLGSQGLSRERLFEEAILQHVLPAFRNGFKLAKYSGPDEDVHLFLQILVKYAQRDLSDGAVNLEKNLPRADPQAPLGDIEALNALTGETPRNDVAIPRKNNKSGSNKSFTTYYSPKDDPTKTIMRSENFVSSGILGLDDILGGGIPRKKLTLLSGQSGSGKTIFAAQFLLEGCRRGEIGIFALSGQLPQDVIQEVDGLGLGLYQAIKQKKIFLVVQDQRRVFRISGIDIINVKDKSDLIGLLRKLVSKKNASRLVIDCLTPLVSGSGNEAVVASSVGQVLTKVSELECTTLVTSDLRQPPKGSSYYGVEENYAAGVVVLRAAGEADRYSRYLYVPKMKCSNHSLKKYVFTIDGRAGIRVGERLQQQASSKPAASGDNLAHSALLSDLSNLVKLLGSLNNGILNFGPSVARQEYAGAVGSPSEGETPYQRNQFPFLRRESLITGAPISSRPPEIGPGYRSNVPTRYTINEAKLTTAADSNPWSSIIMSRNNEEAEAGGVSNDARGREIQAGSSKAIAKGSTENSEPAPSK